MTPRQGKLIASSLFVLAVIVVVVFSFLRKPPPVVHISKPDELTPGETEVVFTTSKGTMIFQLYPKLAPLHVAQFLRLVTAGVYDGSTVIRIEKNFVVQIDAVYARPKPMSKEQEDLVKPIPAEFSDVKHERRTLSMARYDDPDSASASFSVLLGKAPHLDGNYTVFGTMLEESEPTLKAIEALPVGVGTTKPTEVFAIVKAETRPRAK